MINTDYNPTFKGYNPLELYIKANGMDPVEKRDARKRLVERLEAKAAKHTSPFNKLDETV